MEHVLPPLPLLLRFQPLAMLLNLREGERGDRAGEHWPAEGADATAWDGSGGGREHAGVRPRRRASPHLSAVGISVPIL